MYPIKASQWIPDANTCSALHNEGIKEIWDMILKYLELTQGNTYFDQNRKEQNKFWLLQTIDERLKSNFYERADIKKALKQQLKVVEDDKISPFAAATKLLSML